MKLDEFLYVEKYRPKTIDDCILSADIKQSLKSFVKVERIPNLLLSGSPGVGKSTVAIALCNDIGAEYLFINGSDEGRNIDTLRTTIRQFASTISLTDSKKVVIIDEADGMNASSTQLALKSFIEEFSSNCAFIFTCNYKNRVIEAIHSRCTCIDFKIETKDKAQLSMQLFKRIVYILDNELVAYNKPVLVELISKYYPDFRRTLNELQRYAVSGTIDAGILLNVADEQYKQLFNALKDKNFTDVRSWVAQNSDIDSVQLFRKIFDKSGSLFDKGSIPNVILILADYQYKSAFVMDKEINIMACLTEIMSSSKFN